MVSLDAVQTLVHIRKGLSNNEKESPTSDLDMTEALLSADHVPGFGHTFTHIPHTIFLNLSWKEYSLPL